MSKDQFIARWGDEMTGLLLAAFTEAYCPTLPDKGGSQSEEAIRGRFLIRKLKDARALLERIYNDLTEGKPKDGR